MFCQNCGAENSNEAKFCRKCGSLLMREPEAGEQRQLPEKRKKQKGSKKSVKGIIVAAVVAVLLAVAVVVVFAVDFKKIALNDFEYYLSTELENAKEFAGDDFVNLFTDIGAFTANSELTASLSGNALSYEYNEEEIAFASLFEKSTIDLKTSYDGENSLALEAKWMKYGEELVADAVLAILDDDIYADSDTLSTTSYSLAKTLGSNATSDDYARARLDGIVDSVLDGGGEDLKNAFSSLGDLILATYKQFNRFEDFTTVSDVRHRGEKATMLTLHITNRDLAQILDFVLDYWLADEDLMSMTEKVLSAICELDGYTLQEFLADEGCATLEECIRYEMEMEESIEYIRSDDGNWAEYVAIFNKDTVFERRVDIYVPNEGWEGTFISTQTSAARTGEVTTVTVEGNELLQFSNTNEKIAIVLSFYDYQKYELSFVARKDGLDLNLYGYNKEYYCGSRNNRSIYDTLVLNVDLKTTVSKYDSSIDDSISVGAISMTEYELENIAENLLRRLESFYYAEMNEIW